MTVVGYFHCDMKYERENVWYFRSNLNHCLANHCLTLIMLEEEIIQYQNTRPLHRLISLSTFLFCFGLGPSFFFYVSFPLSSACFSPFLLEIRDVSEFGHRELVKLTLISDKDVSSDLTGYIHRVHFIPHKTRRFNISFSVFICRCCPKTTVKYQDVL